MFWGRRWLEVTLNAWVLSDKINWERFSCLCGGLSQAVQICTKIGTLGLGWLADQRDTWSKSSNLKSEVGKPEKVLSIWTTQFLANECRNSNWLYQPEWNSQLAGWMRQEGQSVTQIEFTLGPETLDRTLNVHIFRVVNLYLVVSRIR